LQRGLGLDDEVGDPLPGVLEGVAYAGRNDQPLSGGGTLRLSVEVDDHLAVEDLVALLELRVHVLRCRRP
jgi:hypothetical protein